MAFNGNFTASPVNNDISAIHLVDTSTGFDGGITARRVYLYKDDGTLLKPSGSPTDYINWPINTIAGDTLDIHIMDKDYALSIVVNWVSSAPLAPPSTYTKTVIAAFVGYSNAFRYELIQQMAANLLISTENNFFNNMEKLAVDIDNASLAAANSDQFSAQRALDRVKNLIDNKSIYF